MDERIIIVNEKDEEIGTELKEKCHDGEGILHRAFLAIVIDSEKNIWLCN